jgi:hypothetical protein
MGQWQNPDYFREVLATPMLGPKELLGIYELIPSLKAHSA